MTHMGKQKLNFSFIKLTFFKENSISLTTIDNGSQRNAQ
jgi:hypothetical protein